MSGLLFFPGLHQPGDAAHFALACVSINRLLTRQKPLGRARVLVDSAAYTILDTHGCYPESHSEERYAHRLYELHTKGIVRIIAASTQDYMCEPHIRAKTGLSIEAHQRLTVERYDRIKTALERLFGGPPPFHFMPVLQGQTPEDYVRHIKMYGDRLTPGMWVGVGSVCKRQGDVRAIEAVLLAIKEVRPDLRLHGFRREADSAHQRRCSRAAAYRRQHGVVRRSKEGGPPLDPQALQDARSKGKARRSAPTTGGPRSSTAEPKRLARGARLRPCGATCVRSVTHRRARATPAFRRGGLA